jgi:aminoglycoside phosphotransferase family enzyme/predicted kinase
LVLALGDPRTYSRSPHHAGAAPVGAVELRETLISWIALVGPLAYKVKKPVRYDFIDYATLEKRRASCRMELELNRRWAPELYLGLSAFVRDDAGLGADVAGEPVEYAVRMRRFAQEAELAELVRRGATDATELAQFGRFIAEQHEIAPPGEPGKVRDDAAFELAQRNMRDLCGARSEPALDTLRQWSVDEWAMQRSVLAHRHETGRVRECHGDLHCGNVVRIGQRLLPFDGIDFDAALRFIDVASDVAFLIMDLEAHDRPDLATAFLSGWLERSGDYEALSCLRFFLVYRALVRAKVALLRSVQGASAGDAAAGQADRYLSQAARYTQSRSGALVLMHGFSGSGKSVLALRLAPAIAAVCIRADVERDRILPRRAGSASPSRPNDDRYAPAGVRRVYDALAAAARLILKAGGNAIVDATFLDPERRADFVALARELGAPLAVVDCEAAPDLLRARVSARRDDPSEATIDILERQLRTSAPLRDEERGRVVAVRTAEAPDTAKLARAIEETLGVPLRGLDGSYLGGTATSPGGPRQTA